MATYLSDEESTIVTGLLQVLNEIENGVIQDRAYFTKEELEELFVRHMGYENWAIRKANGVVTE